MAHRFSSPPGFTQVCKTGLFTDKADVGQINADFFYSRLTMIQEGISGCRLVFVKRKKNKNKKNITISIKTKG